MAGIYLTQEDREKFIWIFDNYFYDLQKYSKTLFDQLNDLCEKTQYEPYITFVKTSASAYNAVKRKIDQELHAVDIKTILRPLQAGDAFEREFVGAFTRVCAGSRIFNDIIINTVSTREPEMGNNEFEEVKKASKKYSEEIKKTNENAKEELKKLDEDNELSTVFNTILNATVVKCGQFIISFDQTLQRFEDAYSQIRSQRNPNPNPNPNPPSDDWNIRSSSLNNRTTFLRRGNSNSNNGGGNGGSNGNGGGNGGNQQQNQQPIKVSIADFGPAIAMVKQGDIDDRFEAFCNLTRVISNKVKPNIPLDENSKEDAKKIAVAYEYILKNMDSFIVLKSLAKSRKEQWNGKRTVLNSIIDTMNSAFSNKDASVLDISERTVGKLNSDKANINELLDNKFTTQEIVSQVMNEAKPKFKDWSSYDDYVKITQKVIADPNKMGWAFLALSRNLAQNTRLSTSSARFSNKKILGIHMAGEDTAKNAPARLEYHLDKFADMLLDTQGNAYWKDGYSRLKYDKEDLSLISKEDAVVNTRMLLERYRMEQVRTDRYLEDMWDDFNSAKKTGGQVIKNTMKLVSTAASIACPELKGIAIVAEAISDSISAMENASSLDIKEYLKTIFVNFNPQMDVNSPLLEEKVGQVEGVIAKLASVDKEPDSTEFKAECKEAGLSMLSTLYELMGFGVDDNDMVKTKAVLSTLYDAKEKFDETMESVSDFLPDMVQRTSKELARWKKESEKYDNQWDAVKEYFQWRGERYPVLSEGVAKCTPELRLDMEAAYLSSLMKLRDSLGVEPSQQQIATACKLAMKDYMHYDIESEPLKSALACLV